MDTSLNNLFDSIKLKNGPLVHQHTFDLTRLLEEEFAKSNLNASDSIGSALGNSDDGENDGSNKLLKQEGRSARNFIEETKEAS